MSGKPSGIDETRYTQLRPLSTVRDLFDLQGRVGLITGGGGMMARQFARVLKDAGARVILSDLDPGKTEAAAAETGAEARACDVTDTAAIRALMASIEKDHGRLDFLVNNVMAKPAGYYRPLEQYPEETWNGVVGANLGGVFQTCREALRLLRKSKSPSVVITASIYGLVGADQRIYEGCKPGANLYGGSDPLSLPAAYSASKGGLVALTRHLAAELGPEGIRVNTLVPGGVYDGQEPAFHEAYVQRVPLGRMATWTDCNGAALFLVSDASRYMTGAQLVVDGGWTAW